MGGRVVDHRRLPSFRSASERPREIVGRGRRGGGDQFLVKRRQANTRFFFVVACLACMDSLQRCVLQTLFAPQDIDKYIVFWTMVVCLGEALFHCLSDGLESSTSVPANSTVPRERQ